MLFLCSNIGLFVLYVSVSYNNHTSMVDIQRYHVAIQLLLRDACVYMPLFLVLSTGLNRCNAMVTVIVVIINSSITIHLTSSSAQAGLDGITNIDGHQYATLTSANTVCRVAHVCMHTCRHTDTQTHTHTQTHIRGRIHTFADTYIHTCMHACMHAYIHTLHTLHTYIQLNVHTYIHTYMHLHKCIKAYKHTSMQADKHTSMHAYKHACIQSIYVHKNICSMPVALAGSTLWVLLQS